MKKLWTEQGTVERQGLTIFNIECMWCFPKPLKKFLVYFPTIKAYGIDIISGFQKYIHKCTALSLHVTHATLLRQTPIGTVKILRKQRLSCSIMNEWIHSGI